MNNKAHLFCDATLSDFIAKRTNDVALEIDSLTEAQLLTGTLDDYAAALMDKYRLEPVVLLTDKIVTERGVAKIDVRHDWNRMIRDQSRPHFLEGMAIIFVVPFSGDPSILTLQPQKHHISPPIGGVVANEIHVRYEAIEVDAQKMQSEGKNKLVHR